MNKNTYKHLSVLVVEDDPDIRTTLYDILSLLFSSVNVAADAYDGLDMIRLLNPDIVITDINMPDLNGLDMVELAKKSKSLSSIFIVVSAFDETELFQKAIDNKVDAYLLKPLNIEKLLEKIETILNQKSINSITEDSLHLQLSTREYDVFIDIAKGLKPIYIAEKYAIKAKTVSTYRKRILDKMELTSNADITRYALGNKLI